jgi:hypothetical protein
MFGGEGLGLGDLSTQALLSQSSQSKPHSLKTQPLIKKLIFDGSYFWHRIPLNIFIEFRFIRFDAILEEQKNERSFFFAKKLA